MATLLIATSAGLYALDGDGAPRRLADGDVVAVAPGAGGVWAVADDTTLMRGDPQRGLEPVATCQRALRCVLPLSPGVSTSPHDGEGVLAGTAEAGLVRLERGRLVPVAGFDAVDGRETWHTPWGGPPDTRSLAAGADGALYANVHVGGIPCSLDGGATWQPTIDVEADVHQVATAGGLVLAAAAWGLAFSADRGATWRWRTEGLHARYARAVAAAGDTVLVSVSRGPGGAESALYRGALAAEGPLSRCRRGLPEWFSGNVDTGALVACGATVAAADGSTVYASTDAGATWQVLVADLPPVRALAPVAG